VCPFVDLADPRCAARLTMANLVSAFAYCADRYTDCPVYSRQIAEHAKLIAHVPSPRHAARAVLRAAS
jgi:hypothetical protein